MLVYYFVPFIVSNRYLLSWVSNGHNSVTVQNRTHVHMNFCHHKGLGNHLLQLCTKVVKHSVYTGCPRRNVPDFGRVFLMLKYTDITQNTYVQNLNGYGDKGRRKVWFSCGSTYCTWFAWCNTHTLRIVRPCLQPAQARSLLLLHM